MNHFYSAILMNTYQTGEQMLLSISDRITRGSVTEDKNKNILAKDRDTKYTLYMKQDICARQRNDPRPFLKQAMHLIHQICCWYWKHAFILKSCKARIGCPGVRSNEIKCHQRHIWML